ncbi:diguanylate cyclase [Alkalihalobacillus sp. MEB130]|uniref:histidine kinase N-terminal 7TM domain-containing diguanylate cyclase n=1 Tax=Alkalihalobacillus sp. MEB130 TaxID=2976704 RepID=UPI0028DDDD6D|nr:histidine kinase N-terminal 7TM domain-containing protein [Alkalihalobacillus sp. MEB130]MDT8861580.1 diguanylate cyclase [Alkalihalobacillus sp. MEB130]
MAQELMIYMIVGICGGILSLFLCVYAIVKIKYAPGGFYFILATFMIAIFTFSYTLEMTSTTIEQVKFWLRIEYIALPFLPVFILCMCMEYVGYKMKRWMYGLLYGIPILTLTTHYTNDFHSLYYTAMELSKDGPFPVIVLEGGPFFHIHSIFLYVCIILSVGILLMQLRKVTSRFRLQLLMMITGLIIPVIGSVFYLTGLSPYGLDLGPLSMSISLLFHAAALVSFQMFNVAPIARDSVFESLTEGVIVLNLNHVIVDYNNAVLSVIPEVRSRAVGKSIFDLVNNDHLTDIIRQKQESDYNLLIHGKVKHFHIRFSPVQSKKGDYIGTIMTLVDVTERVQMQEELQKLANIDGLTQVFNRRFFLQASETSVSLLSEEEVISLIMFDIDHFKKVNDTYGHAAGDTVLTFVVNITKEFIRPTDIFGRYGGEEFVVCLPKTSEKEAMVIAQAIRLKIEESFIFANENKINVTSSFGVSSKKKTKIEGTKMINELLLEADEALYQSKKNGRNCVEFYQSIIAV